MTAPTSPAPGGVQTLSRGIRILEILAESPEPLTIQELAEALAVHRSIAYRLLRTLEDHGLVLRNASGAVLLGPRMAALARGVARELHDSARPVLQDLAEELRMTCFIAMLDHREVVTTLAVEPRRAHATVAQRPGTRHDLSRGAPGLAIQATLTEAERGRHAPDLDDEAGCAARERGYATSRDEVIAGLASIAVPLRVQGQPPAALAVVYLGDDADVVLIANRLRAAAEEISA